MTKVRVKVDLVKERRVSGRCRRRFGIEVCGCKEEDVRFGELGEGGIGVKYANQHSIKKRKNDDKTDRDNHDETNGDNDDIDEDDGDENIRNEKEKKNVDEGNKEEAGSENVKGDKVEQKDENVEEVKENKKVPDYRVWEKSKAIVPFVEVNVPGGSNAVDSQETLNYFFRNELEDFEPLTLSLENGKKYSNKRRKLPVFDDISILNTQLESEKISDGKVLGL
ncbi:hypothetical protein Tco_0791520 [Tanacetum coccineum]